MDTWDRVEMETMGQDQCGRSSIVEWSEHKMNDLPCR